MATTKKPLAPLTLVVLLAALAHLGGVAGASQPPAASAAAGAMPLRVKSEVDHHRLLTGSPRVVAQDGSGGPLLLADDRDVAGAGRPPSASAPAAGAMPLCVKREIDHRRLLTGSPRVVAQDGSGGPLLLADDRDVAGAGRPPSASAPAAGAMPLCVKRKIDHRRLLTGSPRVVAQDGGSGGPLLLADHHDVTGAGQPPAASAAAMPRWVKREDRRLLTGWPRVDSVVAQDGSGDHSTIMDALKEAPPGNERFTIYVKKGVYPGMVEIYRSNVMLLGDGPGKTIITGNRSNMTTKHGTPCTATVSAQGSGFMARGLTIENTAGPMAKQAVALLCNSNHSVVFGCEIKGYQDTLLAENHLQFYRDCEISGTVDIVFGDAAAVFQNCVILARRPDQSQYNVITAQGRGVADAPTGFSFQGCKVTTREDLRGVDTYLGRPWREHSSVVFMQSYLDAIVHPAGWVSWKKDAVDITTTRTVFYGEYRNEGPGADLRRRVKWPGFHQMKHAAQALKYTVGAFIHGDEWLPDTGVTYKSGL